MLAPRDILLTGQSDHGKLFFFQARFLLP